VKHAYYTGKSNKVDNTVDNAVAPLQHISSIQLLDTAEVDSLSPQEASSHLQKLLEIQKQLASKQLHHLESRSSECPECQPKKKIQLCYFIVQVAI
jgi:hypothetical protein